LDRRNSFLEQARIHLNVPEGAVPKDGPSAGVTMASAFMSLAFDKPLKQDLAMTGELTLTGKVLKIGGIKEKVIAAKRENVKTLLLPRLNEADYVELKDYLKAGLTAHFIDHFDDLYAHAFEEGDVPALKRPSRGLPVVTITTPEAPTPEPSKDSGSDSSDSSLPKVSEMPVPPVAPTQQPVAVAMPSRRIL